MLIKTFSLLLILFLIADAEASTASLAARQAITPIELGNRNFSTTPISPENIVIRQQAPWVALWRERMAGSKQSEPTPGVDFDQKMVIGIFLGGYANSCYRISIVSVEQEAERTWVSYQVNPPAETDICAQAIVYPLKLIAVPKKSGEVLFVDISKNH